jgi:acid phosphatase family membrane protein YuiD
MLSEVLSPYLITIFVAWLMAHLVKYVVSSLRNEDRKFISISRLFMSGGMPSSHSTTVVAVATIVGLRDGISSGLFGVAALVTLIVCYDAVKVRRSAGEQGEAICALIKEQKSKVKLPRAAKGHEPMEVMAGAILGLTIGVVVFLSTI